MNLHGLNLTLKYLTTSKVKERPIQMVDPIRDLGVAWRLLSSLGDLGGRCADSSE